MSHLHSKSAFVDIHPMGLANLASLTEAQLRAEIARTLKAPLVAHLSAFPERISPQAQVILQEWVRDYFVLKARPTAFATTPDARTPLWFLVQRILDELERDSTQGTPSEISTDLLPANPERRVGEPLPVGTKWPPPPTEVKSGPVSVTIKTSSDNLGGPQGAPRIDGHL